MTTAEKLALIADNMKKVYDAGAASGGGSSGSLKVDVRTIHFGDSTFGGTTEDTLQKFEHGLGVAPIFVAIYANDIDDVITKANGTTYTVQADRLLECPRTYLYLNASGVLTAASFTDEFRLIDRWDATNVYVNAPHSSRPWPAQTLSEFTMVCIGKED